MVEGIYSWATGQEAKVKLQFHGPALEWISQVVVVHSVQFLQLTTFRTTFASLVPHSLFCFIGHISFIFHTFPCTFTMCLVKRLHRVQHEMLLLPVTILSLGWLEQGIRSSGLPYTGYAFFVYLLYSFLLLLLAFPAILVGIWKQTRITLYLKLF